jgi:hypothetical protein
MRALWKGLGRRRGSTAEDDTVVRRERAERRARRMDSLLVTFRGAGFEARRRLRPLGRAIRAFLARIAPPITGALFAVVRALGLMLVRLVELGTAVAGWTEANAFPFITRIANAGAARVTPVNTLAVVAGVAAVTLAISQWLDFHGVAVGAKYYQGEVGTVAPAPMVDLERTGDAHLFVMVPIAVAALVLLVLTVMGNWRLGRVIAGLGLVGLLISVAIDVPQGLDAGTAGTAFDSADAQLLKGFWIQVTSCAVLAVCGLLLASHVRAEVEGEGEARDDEGRLAAADSHADPPQPHSRPPSPGWGAQA